MKYTIRTADKSDQDFLFEMLYQSIYVEPDMPKPDRAIIESPEISKYVKNWGKQGDYALIAADETGNRLGIVWLRYFDRDNKGYGFISEKIPEMGIAVEHEFRGNGIGTFLLTEMLERTKMKIESISLSVQAVNPACRLYKRFGFYVYGKESESDAVIMRYDNNVTSYTKRIFKNRADFYKCQPELFSVSGLKFIAEKKLKNTITLARVGTHLFLRYDPNLEIPFSEIKQRDLSQIDDVLIFLADYFQDHNFTWNEPYIYFYKLDSNLLKSGSGNLSIKRINESDYHELNRFLAECSAEDIEEADIYLDEPDPVIFCGYLDEKIVAYVSHRYQSYDIADIGILIHPEHRNRGYGLNMVIHDINWCIKHKKIPLYTVRRDNIGSIALINKLEFTPLIEAHRLCT